MPTRAVEPIIPLLGLCARARAHPAQAALLRQYSQTLSQWEGLPALAEAHGLTPLVYTHLQAAGIALPPAIQHQLLSAYMQHAHAARVRTQVLADILTGYQAAGIEVLVLKGAALAYLVYEPPLLRPMRDIDLLVRAEDAHRAHELLPEIGFTPAPGPHPGLRPDHHHLPALKRVTEGFSVSVEVHHTLDLNERRRPLSYAAYAPAAQSFRVSGVAAQALGREAMLWHVYRHAFCMPPGYEPLRLIWVADLMSLVEAWLDVLDWEQVRRQYRAAWDVLPLLHSASPWSDAVLERLQLPVPRQPGEAGARSGGWPLFVFAQQQQWKRVPRLLRNILFPPEWRAQKFYGEGPARAGYWRAWLAYQRWLWRRIAQVLQLARARLRFK